MPLKIVITSDFHGKLPTIPPCDLLLIAGDITPGGSVAKQALWLDTSFKEFLDTAPAQHIVFVAGNHDSIFEKAFHLVSQDLKALYLQDSYTKILGITIYGMPWQLPFYGSFNASETKMETLCANIPPCDILLSHGPALGLLDGIKKAPFDPESELLFEIVSVGSKALKEKILCLKPKLVVTGHIHEAYGQTHLDSTRFINGSYMNEKMIPANSPIITYL